MGKRRERTINQKLDMQKHFWYKLSGVRKGLHRQRIYTKTVKSEKEKLKERENREKEWERKTKRKMREKTERE